MKWSVVKTGAELFDLLHAYGLGIVLASACTCPIEVSDTGCLYTLTGDVEMEPTGSLALLDTVLTLPTLQEVEDASKEVPTLPVANLDGLLTVLFTSPGPVRALSVADVMRKQRLNTTTVERAIRKASEGLALWKKVCSKGDTEHWLTRVLQEYSSARPSLPIPAERHPGRDLSVVMMLDPSFSYSTHRPRSDGLVSHKTQITIQGTSFAVLLAIVGAARFLRAQRVSGNQVNCYVPKAEVLTLDQAWCLPLLAPVTIEASSAFLLHCISYASDNAYRQTRWTGLVYQTIQTQGMQQSIPRSQGSLDLTWLTSLPTQYREPLFSFWRILLSVPPEYRPCECDALVDALSTRSLRGWIAHVLAVARTVHTAAETIRPYRLEEIQEVIHHMQTSIPSLLKKALEQKTGTLRFGQALRLLGDVNAAALRDLVEDLDAVTTLDQLFHVLALAAQACQLAAAKTKFIVVPSEDDLGSLLADVEQSSPQTIARFLVLLSALRYPRLDDAELSHGRLTRLVLLLTTILFERIEGNGEEPGMPLIVSFNEKEQQDKQETTKAERKAENEHEEAGTVPSL